MFADLENIFIISGISRPIPARFIGESKGKYFFEPLRFDFKQRKNGTKLIVVINFEVGKVQIQGKKVIILKL